ncbi:MAG: hypothetical protein CFE46_18860 [Burkholderiales bacterium PBB6]|uniref:Uncharacterized protein n=1 Tax=Ideonella margarita TaxID=2984191 RepID=A0ABU9C8W9_9BURK|nr:MAG: hypothetical protein CFE46_18860 [Burkholderiales bacterium PBB6]
MDKLSFLAAPLSDVDADIAQIDPTADWADSSPHGEPQDRAARLAARRAFVDMKLLFMRAVADLAGPKGLWLQHQVRQANDPNDLWVLRGALLVALHQRSDLAARKMRGEIYRQLDSVFPDSLSAGPSSMPPVPEPWALPEYLQPQARLRR